MTFSILLLILWKTRKSRPKPKVFTHAAHLHYVAHVVDVNK